MPRTLRRTLALVLAPLALAACATLASSGEPALQPGLWEFRNVPTAASLDGQPLYDLPLDAPTSETACLTPAAAADRVAFFTRDSDDSCAFPQASLAGGKVAIVGSCPSHDNGLPDGVVRLTGDWSNDRYALAFSTIAHGENGTMGFDGTMTGRRIGDCR